MRLRDLPDLLEKAEKTVERLRKLKGKLPVLKKKKKRSPYTHAK
jgi:hypothetical protein